MKNQGNGTNVGQEDSTALTGIVSTLNFHHIFHSFISFISTFFQLLRCVNIFFYFSPVNFIFNLALPAIFITQLAHSCFPVSFVVEALTAKVIHRTVWFVARPTATFTATETPHCGRRPECDCR